MESGNSLGKGGLALACGGAMEGQLGHREEREKDTHGLSTTNTSSSFRSPRHMPLLTNSFLRVSPSPSASPIN